MTTTAPLLLLLLVPSGQAGGPGLVAFVLEDPMDVRRFERGDVVQLESRDS